ncbi:MAG TPA: adenylate kinase [Planctomycetes bacterium]|nr:adenylate kinase [Planctomycetota bacterium]
MVTLPAPHSKPHDHHAVDSVHEQAATVFRTAWSAVQARVESGEARLPREIIWLGGAPGAGKGTNTPFILRERGITAPPIVTSDLLNTPEMRRIKDAGNLVGDADVVRLLFERLLEPAHATGVLVDGFPRTRVQVECVKLFYQRILDLRSAARGTPKAAFFAKPIFQIVVLYVEEKESVERQLKRGRAIIAANQRVRETGEGVLQEERATDMAEDACRKRYRVFMEQTYHVLQSLKQHFHFHVINAQGDLGSVERAIIQEFQYQSSLELDEETFDAIHHIPLASEIVQAARQHLVERLEGYQRDQATLFRRVIETIERDFVPAIVLHAITGLAKITSDNELFADPQAIAMLVDVLNERGYRTTATVETREVPTRIDPATHYVICTRKPRYRFELRFAGSQIRRGI